MKAKNKLVSLVLAAFMLAAGILSPSKSYADVQDLEEWRKEYVDEIKNMTAEEIDGKYEDTRNLWNYFYGYYGTAEQRKPFIQMVIKRIEGRNYKKEDYYPEIYQEFQDSYQAAKAHALQVYDDPNASDLDVTMATRDLAESTWNLSTKKDTDESRQWRIDKIKELEEYPNEDLNTRIETIKNTNSDYEQAMAHFGSYLEEYKNLDAYKNYMKNQILELSTSQFIPDLSDEREEYYFKEIDKQDTYKGALDLYKEADREFNYYNGLGGPQVEANIKEALKIHPYLKATEEKFYGLQTIKKVMPNTAKKYKSIIDSAEKDAKEALTEAKRFILMKTRNIIYQEWDYYNDYEVYDELSDYWLNKGK